MKILKVLALMCFSLTALAARGPDCYELENCSSGVASDFIGYLFFGTVLMTFLIGTFRSHGLKGLISPALWMLSMLLSVYLVRYGLPIWFFIIPFTGVWWYDPVMKKLGLRDKDYEP